MDDLIDFGANHSKKGCNFDASLEDINPEIAG
jgi:hypothetical protein